MAKILSQLGIETATTVEAWHITQSIDAFTGVEAYDISLSGSFNMTGSITGDPGVINQLTSSYSITSSHAENTISASYALNALSASYAVSASYEINYETSSSYAESASFSSTASYALTALSASYAPNFANTDLTFTGNRTHDTSGSILAVTTDGGVYNTSYLYITPSQASIGSSNFTGYSSYGDDRLEETIYSQTVFKANLTESAFHLTSLASKGNFRILSSGSQHMFFISGSQDRIGIRKNNPNATLDISGSTILSGSLTVSGSTAFRNEVNFFSTANFTAGPTTYSPTGFNRAGLRVDGTTSNTLSDGTDGQILYILCTQVVNPGTNTVTPSNANGFTSIDFNAVGDTATLLFSTNDWYLISYYGATINP